MVVAENLGSARALHSPHMNIVFNCYWYTGKNRDFRLLVCSRQRFINLLRPLQSSATINFEECIKRIVETFGSIDARLGDGHSVRLTARNACRQPLNVILNRTHEVLLISCLSITAPWGLEN